MCNFIPLRRVEAFFISSFLFPCSKYLLFHFNRAPVCLISYSLLLQLFNKFYLPTSIIYIDILSYFSFTSVVSQNISYLFLCVFQPCT